MKTLVLGASTNPNRYSFIAIEKLNKYGHEVVAIGNKIGKVGETEIIKDKILYSEIDTIAMYLSPKNQTEFLDYILLLNPRRIIFNPGTENYFFAKRANKNGIKTYNSCVLVMLSLKKY